MSWKKASHCQLSSSLFSAGRKNERHGPLGCKRSWLRLTGFTILFDSLGLGNNSLIIAERRCFMIAFSPMKEVHYAFGIDIGGTNTKIGFFDDRGTLIAFHHIPTDKNIS